ncbi:MAG: hypothetical protein ACLR56_10430 [Oscillospiraceae bacterium]
MLPNTADSTLAAIDKICVNTLKECEQDVFEDGPKRDRRLWIGDLRLQALVDYVTFRNTDLIKRCIYLFAEHLNEKGLVPPCVFPILRPMQINGFTLIIRFALCFALPIIWKIQAIKHCPRSFRNCAAPNRIYRQCF